MNPEATMPEAVLREGSWIVRLLRDRDRVFEEIVEGREVGRKARAFLLGAAALMGFYGVTMGLYNGPLQGLVSAVKVPALYLGTLFVCYPALYVIHAFCGVRLGFVQTLALILSSFAYTGVLMASLAPIALFFALTGGDYAFLKLLHVVFCGITTTVGLVAMHQSLVIVCYRHDVYPRLAMRIFRIWLFLFAFVGTQMAWNLRPFVGSKDLPFELFRQQESNFYKAVCQSASDLWR
jgi:hypothetical protein